MATLYCDRHGQAHSPGGIACRKRAEQISQERRLTQSAAQLMREKRAEQGRELYEAKPLHLVPKTDDGVLWEDEGIVHRAALTSEGSQGDALLWVAQIKNMDGHTVYLTPKKRRALAAALLDGLPEEN